MKSLRHIALCLAALLFAIPSAEAAPPEDAQLVNQIVIRSAYFQRLGEGAAASDDLFAFVSQESEWESPLKVTAGVKEKGKMAVWDVDGLQTVADSGRKVSYLLLVDHSNSMKSVLANSENGDRVTRFARELVRRSGDNGSYALASFGAEFQLEREFTTDTGAFIGSVEQIKYGERASDLSKAILAAEDYLSGYARDEGELVNLVLITDAIPEETGEDSLALDEVTKRLEDSPSVLVHTYVLCNRNREESAQGMETMASMGLGAHETTLDANPLTAAKRVTAMVNGLYAFRFPTAQRQSEQALDVELYFNGSSVVSMRIPQLSQTETAPVSDGTPADSSAEEPSGETPDGSEGENTQGDSSSEGGGDASSGGTSVGGSSSGGSSAGGSSSGGGSERKGLPVAWIAAGAAGIAALAGIGFFLLRRRPADTVSRPAGNSVCMVLDIISGECVAKERRFYLSDELIIGKSRRCDIVWKDSCMAPQCVRIFLSNQSVCIEDIGSFDGVYLGGMRLHNANRLRSGDEIAIGTVRFRFKF